MLLFYIERRLVIIHAVCVMNSLLFNEWKYKMETMNSDPYWDLFHPPLSLSLVVWGGFFFIRIFKNLLLIQFSRSF